MPTARPAGVPGTAEIALFTWFAKRPTAQAKAAVICSLLPWPDDEPRTKRPAGPGPRGETGRYAAWQRTSHRDRRGQPCRRFRDVDPFSGRGMIPLEAARLGFGSRGGRLQPCRGPGQLLLADARRSGLGRRTGAPVRTPTARSWATCLKDRLLHDLERHVRRIQRAPRSGDEHVLPRAQWAHSLGATCGRSRFPARSAGRQVPADRLLRADPPAASAPNLIPHRRRPRQRHWEAVVNEGPPTHTPTLSKAVVAGRKVAGKTRSACFCAHPHPSAVHRRLLQEGTGEDALLLAADIDRRGQQSIPRCPPPTNSPPPRPPPQH